MTASNASAPSATDNERRAHEPSMEDILASIRKIIADDDALPLSRPVLRPSSTPVAPSEFPKAAADPRPFAASSAGLPASPNVTPLPVLGEPPAKLHEQKAAEVKKDINEPAVPGAKIENAKPSDSRAPEVKDTAGPGSVRDIQAKAPEVKAEQPAARFGSDDFVFRPSLAHAAVLKPESPAAQSEPQRIPRGPSPGPASRNADESGVLVSTSTNATVASAFQALTASVALNNGEMIERHVREMLRPMLKQWLDDNLPVMVERMVRAEIERVARGGN